MGVFKEQVAVQWRLGAAALPALRRMRGHSHLHWTTLRFTFTNNQLRGQCTVSHHKHSLIILK